jgi:starch synthase
VPPQTITSVWMFTREYGHLAGAGGVKDVVSQLSVTLARWNARKVSVVLPCYGFMNPEQEGFSQLADPLAPDRALSFDVAMDYTAQERVERVNIWYRVLDRVHVYLVEAERFLEKNGVYTYTRRESVEQIWKVQGSGHIDYFAMNILLQKAGLELIMLLGERPQIIHCHDGHTAVLPALVRTCSGYRSYYRNTAALVTIHNAGLGYHQDVFDLPFVRAVTGLPWQVIDDSCLGQSFDPFLAAAPYAVISTVSENYARELQYTEADALTGWLGHRLLEMGVIIEGITNGIDPSAFDPAAEQTGLAAPFAPDDETDNLAGKQFCKMHLLQELSQSSAADRPNCNGFLTDNSSSALYTFIGRLSEQKGVDILSKALPLFLDSVPNAAFVCLGSGSERMETDLAALTVDRRYRGRVCFLQEYNPALAREVYAAGDFFIIPSRYEPCGLTDFIAQLYGSLPIVHHIGGLVKVVDNETGFAYPDNSPERLSEALQRAHKKYQDKKAIRAMQIAAVQKIKRQHSWERVMKSYVALYKKCWQVHLGFLDALASSSVTYDR